MQIGNHPNLIKKQKEEFIIDLEKQMKIAAKELDFEKSSRT